MKGKLPDTPWHVGFAKKEEWDEGKAITQNLKHYLDKEYKLKEVANKE